MDSEDIYKDEAIQIQELPRQPLDDRIEKNRRDINKPSPRSKGSDSVSTPTGSNSNEIVNILNDYKTKKHRHSDEDTSCLVKLEHI